VRVSFDEEAFVCQTLATIHAHVRDDMMRHCID